MSWFHFHKWKVLDVQQMKYERRVQSLAGVYVQMPEPITQHVTEVLYGCACGKRKTEPITGHWTLKQVSGS